LRLRVGEIKHAEGRAVVATSGTPVPLVALARLLPPLVERPAADTLAVVLLRSGDRELAIAVDELLAEEEIVVRPVWRDREALPHLSGATILGSGRVALVVNPTTLVETGLSLDAGPGVSLAQAQSAGRTRPRVLVVDDSITTRTLERSILEAAGYDVMTAVDGADAWRVLQEHGSEVVVADVEMPRMNGFGLCATIRGSKRFKELPVILVTALETPEHRARGLEAGADAYIGKSSFDQQRLLDTITQLVG
jgi:two-component system chemotaxis sensor kinase CheA